MAIKGRLTLPAKKCDATLTHLQRAFRLFENMRPQLLTARQLAALMGIYPETAYNYIQRLRRAGCIEAKGGTGKVPLYGLVDGASKPPGDARGRKPKPPRCAEDELETA